MTNNENGQADIYTQVTQKIIADLEKGELTWRKPWTLESAKVKRPLRSNEMPFSGINSILLSAVAAEKNFTSPYFFTARQAEDMGAKVKENETGNGALVVFSQKIPNENENDIESQKPISILKSYTVFNANQIEGLSEKYSDIPSEKVPLKTRIQKLDKFFKKANLDIIPGDSPSYSQMDDQIIMPPVESFTDAVKYYSALSAELMHWTKHPNRLSRDFNEKRFGEKALVMESLVGDLGACFLAADLGFDPPQEKDQEQYIQTLIRVLKEDKRFIFQAAMHAQKSMDYILNLPTEKKQKPVRMDKDR